MDTVIFLQILQTINGVLGIVGNGFVCVVIAKVPAMRTLANAFIFNQALVDLFASLMMILKRSIRTPPLLSSNGAVAFLQCNIWDSSVILWTLFTASTFNLVLLTSERYVAIVYPFRYLAYFSPRRAAVMAAAVWLLAIGYKFRVVFNRLVEGGGCVFTPLSETALQLDGTVTFLVEYLLPLIFMAFCYIHIILQLKKASSSVGAQPATSHQQQGPDNSISGSLLRARRNTLKTLILVSVTYAVCWSPNQIAFFAYNFGLGLDFQGAFYLVSVVLSQFNSCVNPVIYAFKYKQFQRGVRALLKSCFPNLVGRRIHDDSVGLSGLRSTERHRQRQQNQLQNNGADCESTNTGN